MSNYQSILFDLDGTLTDPRIGITKSVKYALDRMGIEEVDMVGLNRFIGPPLVQSFMKYYGLDEPVAKQALAIYREYFAVTGIYENEVYPGIPELLTELKGAGRQIFLATSKPTIFAQRILDHFNLTPFFDGVAGSELDGSRVHKGEVIRYVFESMEPGDKSRTVMVGDREHDIFGAWENGIDSIGVLYGYGSLEELKKARATAVVDSVEELGKKLLG